MKLRAIHKTSKALLETTEHRRTEAKTFTHKNLAVKYLQGVGMAMQTSTYVDPSAGNMSVEAFAAKWISTQGHLKPSTLATL